MNLRRRPSPIPPVVRPSSVAPGTRHLSPVLVPHTESSRFYITEVAVAKAARRRGIARTMMEAVEVHAAEKGVESLFLHVDENNDSALRLYLKNGFKLRKECMESYNFAAALGLLSGSFANTHHLLMVKDLAQASDVALEPMDGASELTTAA